jgi:hypothetical protein
MCGRKFSIQILELCHSQKQRNTVNRLDAGRSKLGVEHFQCVGKLSGVGCFTRVSGNNSRFVRD